MLEAASGNVGIRSAADDGKANATAGAAVEAAAGAAEKPAEEPAAEPSVDVEDETEALLRNCLADMRKVDRKRKLHEMQRLEDLHVLDIQERLEAQKTKHDEVFFQAQQTIKQQNVEISTHLNKISQQNTDIEAYVATIATHTQAQKKCHDEQKRLEQENTELQNKMQSSQALCAQLYAVMNPGHSQQHAQQGSLPTSCRQEVQIMQA